MGDIAEAFRDHLRSLSDTEWDALVTEVRTPKPPASPPMANEVTQSERIGTGRNEGLAEAKRRGYID